VKLKDLPSSLVARNEGSLTRAGMLCRSDLRTLPDGRPQVRLWIATRSRANARGKRSELIESNATQRDQTFHGLRRTLGDPPSGPVVVVLTRLGKSVLDDHDNLPTALKGPADGTAAWLGRDDADQSIGWCYRQAVDPVWGILFEVRPVVRRARTVAAALDLVHEVDADPSPTADDVELRRGALAFLANAFV